ncbi:MAG TPA: CPBP family intramembrane glutamic endopeptidase [Bryobacteraceae bacterium]|nr:CPBP family intramembrane glutamic endopeptidase [Bryobacteraceae bacterium]
MRPFLATLFAVWIAACIAAYFYSHQQHISFRIAICVVPAFLLEIACYMVPGFPSVRKRFDALGSKIFRATLLTASGLVPAFIAVMRGHSFNWGRLVALLALILVASFWYVWAGSSVLADLLFLAYMAAIYLARPFDRIYGQLIPHVSLGVLGQLMWIYVGLMAVLSLRSLDDAHLGFLPTAAEWRIGARHFLYFLPVGAALVYIVQLGTFRLHPHSWWNFAVTLILTSCGIFWVVSLAEEFFFRAFLQRVIARGTHNEMTGLILTSVLFGLAHLPFRKFPNWRFAIVTVALGFFCGLSFLRGRSVRASMVTHALVATTWRMFFSG